MKALDTNLWDEQGPASVLRAIHEGQPIYCSRINSYRETVLVEYEHDGTPAIAIWRNNKLEYRGDR